jgi:hypothetical protein
LITGSVVIWKSKDNWGEVEMMDWVGTSKDDVPDTGSVAILSINEKSNMFCPILPTSEASYCKMKPDFGFA